MKSWQISPGRHAAKSDPAVDSEFWILKLAGRQRHDVSSAAKISTRAMAEVMSGTCRKMKL
jgi:hypothetical protein